jgi:hypothetical protein
MSKSPQQKIMKILTAPEIESLLPAICKAWHEQQYPRTLSFALAGLLGRGRPPAMAYYVIAKFAEEWVVQHLIEEHLATVESSARSTAVWVLMDEIVEAVSGVETEAA